MSIMEGLPWKPGNSLPRGSLCLESGQESWKERKVGRFMHAIFLHLCHSPRVSSPSPYRADVVLGCGYWQRYRNSVIGCLAAGTDRKTDPSHRQVTLTGKQTRQDFSRPRR